MRSNKSVQSQCSVEKVAGYEFRFFVLEKLTTYNLQQIRMQAYFKLPTISSGFTQASKSSGVTYPKRTDSSFKVVPFL